MPLCPQITNTPITVVLNSDFTVTDVIPVLPANTEQVNEALADAAEALAEANDAYAAAIGSLQPSANTIVNASNQITAINGGGITVYSGASPSIGARVVLNSAGLAGFNSSSTGPSDGATFSISASTGAAVFSGDIVSGSRIIGGELNIGGNCSITTSGFLTATGATITGTITSSTITGGTVQTSTGNDAIILNSALNALQFKVANAISGNIVPLGTAGVLMHYGSTPDPTGSTFPKVQMSFAAALLQGSSDYYVQSTNAGNSALGDFRMFNNLTVDGELTVAARVVLNSGVIRFPNIGGITGGTNMRFDTATGRVYYLATSSRTVKDNIVDISEVPELDPKLLLDLPIRAFTYKPGQLVDTDDRVDVMVPGFIAEELDQVYPIATDYSDGPLSWNDRFIIPGMLGLIQDLYKQIEILKGE